MAFPFDIWVVLLILAIICTGYLFFIHDKNNYTEAIAGLIAIVFWIISGLGFAVGLTTDINADPYTSVGLLWLFIAIGIIVGLITFVKIMDIMTQRKKEKNSVNMSPIRL